jgi:hypothetical protein
MAAGGQARQDINGTISSCFHTVFFALCFLQFKNTGVIMAQIIRPPCFMEAANALSNSHRELLQKYTVKRTGLFVYDNLRPYHPR